MRASQFITEIGTLPGSSYVGGKEDLSSANKDLAKQTDVHVLPGGSGLQYTIINTRNDNFNRVVIIDPKSTTPGVAQLSLYNRWSFPIQNTVQVGAITVDEDYRGRGLAKALYGIVLTIMKKTLLAGDDQTPSGRRNWVSLANIPGVEIKGYVVLPNEDLLNKSERQQQVIYNMLMKLGGQFIGKSSHSEYWAFDIVPSTGTLHPAIRTSLSKIYDNDNYDVGLMAYWTGK